MNYAEQMIKQIEMQNLTEAKRFFHKVKQFGDDEEQFTLAQTLFHYGFLEEARELYELLHEKHPENSEIKVQLAETFIELNEDEFAYSLLESIPASDPSYGAALLIEADLYEMQGLYEVSERKLLQAKEILTDEPIIDFALGELYLSLGRFVEAANCYEKLLEVGKTSLAGNNINGRLAEALSAGGAFEKSLPYYEASLKNELNVNVLFGYGLTAYQAGQFKKAIQAFTELKEMDHQYQSLYLYLASCYEHVEDLNKALQVVQEGLLVDEFNEDLYKYAGQLSMKLGNETDSENYLREALALNPDSTAVAQTLMKLLLHQERYEDVLEIVTLFDDLHEEAQFHWDAAYSYQKLEKYSEALNRYKLAYNDFKNNPDFLSDYGYFLIEEGEREGAVSLFRRLSKLEPWNDEWVEILTRFEE